MKRRYRKRGMYPKLTPGQANLALPLKECVALFNRLKPGANWLGAYGTLQRMEYSGLVKRVPGFKRRVLVLPGEALEAFRRLDKRELKVPQDKVLWSRGRKKPETRTYVEKGETRTEPVKPKIIAHTRLERIDEYLKQVMKRLSEIEKQLR